MVGYSGNMVLLLIKNAENSYQTVCGMRTTRLVLNNQPIDTTHKNSGEWRQLLENVGIRFVSIGGTGVFTDGPAEQWLRQDAFLGKMRDYCLGFGNGDALYGRFIITAYERVGNIQEEETYSLTLESSGEVRYTARD